MGIPVVHGVGTRREGLTRLTAVRRCARVLSVHHVGGDGQNRSGGDSAAVGVVALDKAHEGVHQLRRDLIHAVVVIPIFREIALHIIIHGHALLIADGLHLGVLDGG